MEKLAVIIPVYINDNIKFIKKSVDSIISQTFTDYKLYIAIDGPLYPDVSSYFDSIQNEKVEIIRYPENRGLAATLNESFKHAKDLGYKYLGRMDADDIALPERLEKQIQFLEQNQQVDAVGTRAVIINSNDEIIGIKDAAPVLTYDILKSSSDIIHPSVVFRSTFFDKVGYYSLGIAPTEDYDLWFRAVKMNIKIVSLSDRLYHFRYDDNLIKRRKDAQGNVLRVKKKHLNFKHYHHLFPHYLIRLTPNFILKSILHRSIKEN